MYSGKESYRQTLSAKVKKLATPSQAVMRAEEPIAKTNRNIIASNWFSSSETLQELQKICLTLEP
jgi:hypothetical protein